MIKITTGDGWVDYYNEDCVKRFSFFGRTVAIEIADGSTHVYSLDEDDRMALIEHLDTSRPEVVGVTLAIKGAKEDGCGGLPWR